ncbi:MAG: DUF2232 domain-containing protein [Candidatus Zixiibacteriota bacterium]|nr:MAG: DUF2232 domain-containing protein [candidate division Zixibacteria bacterium]
MKPTSKPAAARRPFPLPAVRTDALLNPLVVVAGLAALVLFKYGLGFGRLGTAVMSLSLFLAYLVTVYVYASVAMLAYRGKWALLLTAIPVAVGVSLLLSGPLPPSTVVIDWLMPALAGITTGLLLRQHTGVSRPYLAGVAVVTILAVLWLGFQWAAMRETVQMMGDDLAKTMQMIASGKGNLDSDISDQIHQATRMLIRLMPGLMAINFVTQYSLGTLVFFGAVAREDPTAPRPAPFTMWAMPFWPMAIVPVAIGLRYLMGGTVGIIADNLLLLLSVFYCVTGLALVEYWFRKLRLPGLLRIVMYLMLVPAGVFGYLTLAVAGFADSYFDWRHPEADQESLNNEK